MKTGIVLKKEGRKAVLLKSDGSFESVNAKRDWKVGETVPVPVAPRGRASSLLTAAACLAVIALAALSWNHLYLSPEALVSIDVNPSVEMSVNRFGRVVSAAALNDEGTRILEEADVKNAVCREAVAAILNTEGAGGYLAGNADVVLTVFSKNAAVQSDLLSELQGVVDAGLSNYAGPSGRVRTECHAVDETTVNNAHGHGVTAGKYLYLQKLQELAPETDISQYTHHSIEEIKGEIRSCEEKHGGGDSGSGGSGSGDSEEGKSHHEGHGAGRGHE